MPTRREPQVTYSVRVPATLDERVTRIRLRSGESTSAYVLRAVQRQLAEDEAALNAQDTQQDTQGFGEGDEEKR